MAEFTQLTDIVTVLLSTLRAPAAGAKTILSRVCVLCDCSVALHSTKTIPAENINSVPAHRCFYADTLDASWRHQLCEMGEISTYLLYYLLGSVGKIFLIFIR